MSRAMDKDDPIAVIEERIARGKSAPLLVVQARRLWRQTWLGGIAMPNGERVFVSERDLHHLLLEDRVLRKPERIERLLRGIYEIRTTHSNRSVGLSQWSEGARTIDGYAILEEGHLWTAHIVDRRKLRKLARQGDLLWNREEYSAFGEDPNETS